MTDKEKIRVEVKRLYGTFAGKVGMHGECDICCKILSFIDSLPEEPVSEDFEQALKAEWKGYVDRGAATVDALEDNTQELTFAKGFYRGTRWQRQQINKECAYNDLEEAAEKYAYELFPSIGAANTETELAFKAGAKWQKQQELVSNDLSKH